MIGKEERMNSMMEEAKQHLRTKLIPFWTSLRDDRYGGWYGYVDYDLHTDREAVKGCILMSRITWFYANAAMLLGDPDCLKEAEHGFRFIKEHCLDRENGGIYWSVTFDGRPEDTTKHTYNQAFCIYALSSYYDASKDPEALETADSLFRVIETKMRDEGGYLEAFDRTFRPASNEKLSENGVMAVRTMNTLLHVLEGTELAEAYRAGAFEVLSLDAYIRILEECIESIPPGMVVHRLTGDGAKRSLIAPKWSADKKRVLNDINRAFERDQIRQGSRL